ncbi:hypothetical protein HZA57_07390 [Candidatus Poribacteria bacterium]|nr:hypothetical protein [Candidatus Poribacteria bacterium]
MNLFRIPVFLALLAAVMPLRGEVTLTRMEVLDGENGQARPLADHYRTSRSYSALAMAPDETAGMIFRDVPAGRATVRMVLAESRPGTMPLSSTVVEFTSFNPDFEPLALVAYDGESKPHVFYDRSGSQFHAQRSGGTWTAENLNFDLTGFLGGVQGTGRKSFAAIRGLDGRIHLAFSARAGNGPDHLFLASWDNPGWTIMDGGEYRSVLADGAFAFEDFFAFQVDQDGALHVCFETSEPFGDPENLPRGRINWGKCAGGNSTREIIKQGQNVDDKPAWNGFMALDRAGRPFILSTHTTHAETGSMRTAKLYYYTRSARAWTAELIADKADNYTGGDGNKYTGEFPCLAFDAQNRPHVTFADIASWHWQCIPELPDISCNDQIRGQLRYAWKEGSVWKTKTLFTQPGQSASANPLNMFVSPSCGVSEGGRRLFAFGMEHIHHGVSAAYEPDADKDFRVLFFEAENTQGTGPAADTLAIRERLLGRPVLSGTHDGNGDGVVDAADLEHGFAG